MYSIYANAANPHDAVASAVKDNSVLKRTTLDVGKRNALWNPVESMADDQFIKDMELVNSQPIVKSQPSQDNIGYSAKIKPD